jgi:hypothetical protein
LLACAARAQVCTRGSNTLSLASPEVCAGTQN